MPDYFNLVTGETGNIGDVAERHRQNLLQYNGRSTLRMQGTCAEVAFDVSKRDIATLVLFLRKVVSSAPDVEIDAEAYGILLWSMDEDLEQFAENNQRCISIRRVGLSLDLTLTIPSMTKLADFLETTWEETMMEGLFDENE